MQQIIYTTMSNKKIIKKETRKLVYTTIENALAPLSIAVKEKKFYKKMQKASNMLAKDILKAGKKAAAKKHPSKKNKGNNRGTKKASFPQAATGNTATVAVAKPVNETLNS